MKNTKFGLLLLTLLLSKTSFALIVNQEFIKAQAKLLAVDQAASGAFYPINCLDKAMTKNCFTDSSLFFSGLIAESLQEINQDDVKDIHKKAIQYLSDQFKQQHGTLRYYEKTSKLYKIVKPDVDDNGIVLTTLMNHPELADQELIDKKIKYLFEHSKLTHAFSRKGSETNETFVGDYLSTWVNPSRPFFNDIDLVVNFNGLFAFAKYNQRSPNEKIDLGAICSSVNRIMAWSSHDAFSDLISIRDWTRRDPKNYSQWYPSKYAVMLAAVRAHFAQDTESCLTPTYELVRKHLLTASDFGDNAYDQALATAALARILHQENLPKARLLQHIEKLQLMLDKNQLGSDPFLFYGSIGYTSSKAMLRTLLIESASTYLTTERRPASVNIEEQDFLEKVLSEQMDDGSFTALIKPSSPLYNIFVIYLYEYLGQTEKKKELVKRLVEHVFSLQKDNGALSGYPDGPDHPGISTAAYDAGRIAGMKETDLRMKKLELKIKEFGGPLKSNLLTAPFLMIFSLYPVHSTSNTNIDELVLKIDEKLPWIRVLLHPVLFMLDNGHTKLLPESKYPGRIFKQSYEKYAKSSGKPKAQNQQGFLDWATKNGNPDGTFFDYTPTTVPMLMALSHFPAHKEMVDLGVKTIESFQEPTSLGHLIQSPGEASIAETFYIANSLLDVGFGPDHPTVKKAEKYLLAHQMEHGGWGFSKNSIHFGDSDDTSNAMYFLLRLDRARGEKIRAEVFKGMDWLLTLQNKDGGFGTWESTKGILSSLINLAAQKKGMVMSESVLEHTARIVVSLSYLKGESLEAKRAFDQAYQWLLNQQNHDGSFKGTWFVNYFFASSMAVTALGTGPNSKGEASIVRAIHYLKQKQSADGGFGESPESFIEGRAIHLSYSSWTQTGLIAAQLHTLDQLSGCKYHEELRPLLETTHLFLKDKKRFWTEEVDPTWTGVTFPKVEYLIYPYIQRFAPWQAYNMQLTSSCK